MTPDLAALVGRVTNTREIYTANERGNAVAIYAADRDALVASIESLVAENATLKVQEIRAAHLEDIFHKERERAERAEAERDALRKDAERYRWLREESDKRVDFYTHEPRWMVSVEYGGTGKNYFGEKIDAAIDAALANPAAPPSP